MSDIKHILVPTDGSECAVKAAAFADTLASSLGAKVTVLCVLNDDAVPTQAFGIEGLKSIDQVRQAMESGVREGEFPTTLNVLSHVDDVSTTICWGHFAEEISRIAAEQSADLIVMGSHGRSGLKRAFLGSVSQAVANQAPCPVTIVK